MTNEQFEKELNKPRYTLPICSPTKSELCQMKLLIISGKTTRVFRSKTYCVVKGWMERGYWRYTIQITDQTSSKLFEYTPKYYE
jgi:hypothetical protein